MEGLLGPGRSTPGLGVRQGVVSRAGPDRLAAFRSEAQAELEAVEGALVERAAAITEYTDTSVFVPEQAEGGEEVPPEWFGMNPEYGEDSAEVIDSSTEEEDEAEAEGEAEVPEDGAGGQP